MGLKQGNEQGISQGGLMQGAPTSNIMQPNPYEWRGNFRD